MRVTSLLIAAVILAWTGIPALGGAEAPLDRVKSLIEEKRRLQWENERLRQELAFASTPSPYVVVDSLSRTFEFRVRGKTHKTYTATALGILGPGGDPMTFTVFRTIAPAPLTVVEKAGGPLEIKPPSVGGDAGAPASADPNAGPTRTDAGILGVDAPVDYDVKLEGGIRLEIRTYHEKTRWERSRETLSSMGRALSDLFGGWFGRSRPLPQNAPRAAVRATFDEAICKAFYHSVLPGEHFYFAPPPPAPVTLVASLGAPAAQAPGGSAPGKAPAARKPVAKQPKSQGEWRR